MATGRQLSNLASTTASSMFCGSKAIDPLINHLRAPLSRTVCPSLRTRSETFAVYGAKVIGILIVELGDSKPASLTST